MGSGRGSGCGQPRALRAGGAGAAGAARGGGIANDHGSRVQRAFS